MKKILFILVLLIAFEGYGQISPGLHTILNKPALISSTSGGPLDAVSQYYDATNFIYRDYQSIAEARTYLTATKWRVSNHLVFIHVGGTLNSNGTYTGGTTRFYLWANGTADGNLVPLSDFIAEGNYVTMTGDQSVNGSKTWNSTQYYGNSQIWVNPGSIGSSILSSRPVNLWLSGNMEAAGDARIGAAASLSWSGRGRMIAQSDGEFTLYNGTSTASGNLTLGNIKLTTLANGTSTRPISVDASGNVVVGGGSAIPSSANRFLYADSTNTQRTSDSSSYDELTATFRTRNLMSNYLGVNFIKSDVEILSQTNVDIATAADKLVPNVHDVKAYVAANAGGGSVYVGTPTQVLFADADGHITGSFNMTFNSSGNLILNNKLQVGLVRTRIPTGGYSTAEFAIGAHTSNTIPIEVNGVTYLLPTTSYSFGGGATPVTAPVNTNNTLAATNAHVKFSIDSTVLQIRVSSGSSYTVPNSLAKTVQVFVDPTSAIASFALYAPVSYAPCQTIHILFGDNTRIANGATVVNEFAAYNNDGTEVTGIFSGTTETASGDHITLTVNNFSGKWHR